MPTIQYTAANLNTRRVALVTWPSLGNADDGVPWETVWHRDMTIQVVGTSYGSATLVIEGSNNGTNWVTLADPQGNALSFTTGDRIETLLDLPRYIRPRTSGGTGTNLTVSIYCRGTQ